MKFAFVAAWEVAYSVATMCRVLGVSRSGYYAWRDRPAPARRRSDAALALEITATHKRSRSTYGSPRIHADLRARGTHVGKKRVERLMREQGIRARPRRRFVRTTDSSHANQIAPNVVDRRFGALRPNETWVTDVTYVRTAEGWLYLAVILDLFARRVVGWAASATNDRDLVLRALHAALRRRQPPRGLVHHSDRGSPYASDDYRRALERAGITASMSRKGDCWDNAVAESFFASLKVELVDDARYEPVLPRSPASTIHRVLLQPRTEALATRLRQPDRTRAACAGGIIGRIVKLSTKTGESHPGLPAVRHPAR